MITIESSWGIITTDDNGNVIEKDVLEHDGKDRCYLLDAERFDVGEWDKWYEQKTGNQSPKPSSFDVLELGYWKSDGSYVSPSNWRDGIY